MMIDPASIGFDSFLRRRTGFGTSGILGSQLGSRSSYDPGDTDDLFPGGVVHFSQATIGGWIIGDGKLQSADGGLVFNAKDRNIIVNDGTYDRVLIGFQKNGF